MVQNEEIIGLMKGTVPYTKKTLSYLLNLKEEFPYFQTVHLLYTLNLLRLKDTHFLVDLHKTAVYVPDRRQLFFHIEDDFFVPELMETLEGETRPIESPFELINNFLSETIGQKDMKNIEPESSPISTDYASYFLSDKTGDSEAPPLQHQKTIDKFLENDAVSPLTIKLDKTDKSKGESSEHISESTSNDSFFSETLSKIYIKQKKYEKALEIIRKLNLIYPEKNRYFADQIRFLEKLIINANKIK